VPLKPWWHMQWHVNNSSSPSTCETNMLSWFLPDSNNSDNLQLFHWRLIFKILNPNMLVRFFMISLYFNWIFLCKFIDDTLYGWF
jgi:hypothetical protein